MPRKPETRDRKAPSEQTPPGVGGPGGELDSAGAQDSATLLQVETETDPPAPPESFVDFFDNPLDDSEYIDVVRIKPETHNGESVGGYCGRLEPGDRYNELKQKFGGGTFRLNVRDKSTGRMVTTGRVIVAGAPVLPPNTVGVADTRPAVTGSPAGGPVVELDVRGTKVPFQLSAPGLAGLQELLIVTRAADAMFPVRQDISEAILLALLNNRQKDDPLELIGKLRNALPEVFAGSGDGDGGGSDGWVGIVKEAVKQAGPVLANLTAGGNAPRRRPMPLPAPAGEVAALPAPAEPGGQSEVAPMAGVSDFQIAMAMLTELVKAYRLDPPKPADRVVAMLKMSFPLTVDQRKKIVEWRQAAFDWCENQLADVFEESDSARVDFEPWFNSVFDGIAGGA